MSIYIHRPGTEISIGDSLSLLQAANNFDIENLMKVCLSRMGFWGDSFKIFENPQVDINIDNRLYFQSGSVIFPNGKMFFGDNYIGSLAVSPSNNWQYIIAQFQPLREGLGTYAPQFSPTDQYYYRRCGISLTISDAINPTPVGADTLTVCKFLYPLEGTQESSPGSTPPQLELIDLRSLMEPYRSGEVYVPYLHSLTNTHIPVAGIQPSEIAGIDVNLATPPWMKDCWTLVSTQHHLNGNGPHHSMITSQYYNANVSYDKSVTNPISEFGEENTYAYTSIALPMGVSLDSSITHRDCNIQALGLTPTQSSLGYVGAGDIVNPEFTSNFGIMDNVIGARFEMTEEAADNSFMQIWIKEGFEELQVDTTKPPTYEVAIPDMGTPSIYHSYITSPYTTKTIISMRVIEPGQRVSSYKPIDIKYTRVISPTVTINWGLDFHDSGALTTRGEDAIDSWRFYYNGGVDGISSGWEDNSVKLWFSDTNTYPVAMHGGVSNGVLKSAKFYNYYADGNDPTGTIEIQGCEGFALPIGANASGDYVSEWAPDEDDYVSLPSGNTYFILTGGADYIDVRGYMILEIDQL